MFPKTIVTWLRPQVSPTECSEGLIGTGIAWGGGGGRLHPRDGIHKLPSLWNAGWWGRGPRGWWFLCKCFTQRAHMSIFKRESLAFDRLLGPPPKCKNCWSKPVCSAVWTNMAEKKASVEFFFFSRSVMAKWKEYLEGMYPVAASEVELGLSLSSPCFCWFHGWNRGYCLCWECI